MGNDKEEDRITNGKNWRRLHLDSVKTEERAKPRIENGHIEFPNELAEALARVNLSAYESRILWVLWRKTYGWHKERDHISISQFQHFTGLKRRHVSRAISKLVARHIVTRIGNSRITAYEFQKDYTKWRNITKGGDDTNKSRPSGHPVKPIDARRGDRLSLKEVTSREADNRKYLSVKPSVALELATLLLEEIRRNKPDFKEPKLSSWAEQIDLMIRKDKRESERIRKVILWSQGNPFWWKIILSANKLREKFDQLEAEMRCQAAKTLREAKQRPRVEYQDLS